MSLIYKTNEEGLILTNEKGNPIVIDKEKNEEYGLDALHHYAKIPKLREEAKNYRLNAEASADKLNLLASHGVNVGGEKEELEAWVKQATEAIDTVSNLTDGKLVQAGDVETIKKQAAENMQTKLNEQDKLYKDKILELEGSLKEKTGTIYNLMVDDKFNTSGFVNEKLAMTPRMARSYFGPNFQVEQNDMGHNQVVGYFGNGEKIYSKERIGELADFNEALQLMVEKDPDRNSLLKGSHSGSGSLGNTRLGSEDMSNKSSKEKIVMGIKKLKGL